MGCNDLVFDPNLAQLFSDVWTLLLLQQEDCEKAYFKMDNVLIDDRRIHVDFSQSVAKIKWKGKGMASPRALHAFNTSLSIFIAEQATWGEASEHSPHFSSMAFSVP